MTKLAVLPFCSDECRANGGLLLESDPESPRFGMPTGKCPCRNPSPTVDAALHLAAAAHPEQLTAALRVIRDAASSESHVSANSVRRRLDIAQIQGTVRSAAFARAVGKGWILADGEEESTDPGTHGKRITVYRSLIFEASS